MRLVYGMIFAVLSVGSLTMLYPFALMLSGSVKSDTDYFWVTPYPRYLVRDDILYMKYIESKYGKVSHADLSLAESDMGILGRYVGLTVRSREFLELWSRNGKRAELAYALLLQEARDSGGRISEEYVDAYLRQVGVSEDDYNTILSRLRAHQKVGERALRSAVARWLGVMWGFRAKQVGVPPSEPHIKRIFRDLNEKISLRVLEIPAEQFIKDMPEPSEDEILKQFNSYRQATRGEYPSVNSFGFGYHQGNRVRVSYLFVDQEVIGRVVRPAPQIGRASCRERG